MKKLTGIAAACLMLATAAVVAAEKLTSGLPVGESVPAFNVRDITGPNAGKTLCYRCKYGAQPVVAIFTREVNDNVAELIKKIDAQVGENKDAKMAAFVVTITDNPDSVEPKLESLAKSADIKNTPLTIVEGTSGPPNYKISKDAEVTVMMWVESEVKVNEAFGKGGLDKKAVDRLAGETKKILD